MSTYVWIWNNITQSTSGFFSGGNYPVDILSLITLNALDAKVRQAHADEQPRVSSKPEGDGSTLPRQEGLEQPGGL